MLKEVLTATCAGFVPQGTCSLSTCPNISDSARLMQTLICLCLISPNLLTYYGLFWVQEAGFVKAFEIFLTDTEGSLHHL